ncbi:MAG: DUF58 domain-containing protein [Candidatus Hydrogenedentes bacterium]|nr:DUF58 domain-containing protein [Candidatus Hydrogenedentota bacterium]
MPEPFRELTKAKLKLEFRPAGAVVASIFVLVLLTGFNSGENLLYLVALCAASFLICGILLTPIAIRGLRVRREAPNSAYRRDSFAVKVRIENTKRFFPSLSLRLDDPSKPGASQAYVPGIPAGTVAIVQLRYSLPKRGVHTLPELAISSGFPMGLFRRLLICQDAHQVLVYPRVVSVRRNVVERLDDSGVSPRPLDRMGDEFFALREYIPGDDIRYICWRVSARIGRLMVRELEPNTARMVVVVFDTRGLPDTPELEEQFEEAVDLVASLAMMLMDRHFGVAVLTPDASVGLGTGSAHATKILEMLARVQPARYGAHGDEWFMAPGDLGGAAKIYVASDPALWGGQVRGRGVRVLDPREVLNA